MDKRLVLGFVREVILQKDTPSLILLLAGSVRYLILCREIVISNKTKNNRLFDLLHKVCFEHGIDLEWLKNRLTPAARALGLKVERVAQLDYYAILGIDKDADLPKIKSAYRKKAYLTHPDANGPNTGKNKAFIEINDAYQTLRDKFSRRHYDLSRKNLSKWSEEPAIIVKAKNSRKNFAFQLISLLLILIVMFFVFDYIFRESNTLKSYDHPELFENAKDPRMQNLSENLPDLRLKENCRIKNVFLFDGR
jgi:hypothetical protein